LVLPFWYRLTQVVLEKRPLNGCVFSALPDRLPASDSLRFGFGGCGRCEIKTPVMTKMMIESNVVPVQLNHKVYSHCSQLFAKLTASTNVPEKILLPKSPSSLTCCERCILFEV